MSLYSSTSINLVEAADKVKTLVLTVGGLQNGSAAAVPLVVADPAASEPSGQRCHH